MIILTDPKKFGKPFFTDNDNLNEKYADIGGG